MEGPGLGGGTRFHPWAGGRTVVPTNGTLASCVAEHHSNGILLTQVLMHKQAQTIKLQNIPTRPAPRQPSH